MDSSIGKILERKLLYSLKIWRILWWSISLIALVSNHMIHPTFNISQKPAQRSRFFDNRPLETTSENSITKHNFSFWLCGSNFSIKILLKSFSQHTQECTTIVMCFLLSSLVIIVKVT